MSNISVITAKLLSDFRRFLIENDIKTVAQLDAMLEADREWLAKEKAPVKGLGENNV